MRNEPCHPSPHHVCCCLAARFLTIFMAAAVPNQQPENPGAGAWHRLKGLTFVVGWTQTPACRSPASEGPPSPRTTRGPVCPWYVMNSHLLISVKEDTTGPPCVLLRMLCTFFHLHISPSVPFPPLLIHYSHDLEMSSRPPNAFQGTNPELCRQVPRKKSRHMLGHPTSRRCDMYGVCGEGKVS